MLELIDLLLAKRQKAQPIEESSLVDKLLQKKKIGIEPKLEVKHPNLFKKFGITELPEMKPAIEEKVAVSGVPTVKPEARPSQLTPEEQLFPFSLPYSVARAVEKTTETLMALEQASRLGYVQVGDKTVKLSPSERNAINDELGEQALKTTLESTLYMPKSITFEVGKRIAGKGILSAVQNIKTVQQPAGEAATWVIQSTLGKLWDAFRSTNVDAKDLWQVMQKATKVGGNIDKLSAFEREIWELTERIAQNSGMNGTAELYSQMVKNDYLLRYTPKTGWFIKGYNPKPGGVAPPPKPGEISGVLTQGETVTTKLINKAADQTIENNLIPASPKDGNMIIALEKRIMEKVLGETHTTAQVSLFVNTFCNPENNLLRNAIAQGGHVDKMVDNFKNILAKTYGAPIEIKAGPGQVEIPEKEIVKKIKTEIKPEEFKLEPIKIPKRIKVKKSKQVPFQQFVEENLPADDPLYQSFKIKFRETPGLKEEHALQRKVGLLTKEKSAMDVDELAESLGFEGGDALRQGQNKFITKWMAQGRIGAVEGFEKLAETDREALTDYIQQVNLMRFQEGIPPQTLLENFNKAQESIKPLIAKYPDLFEQMDVETEAKLAKLTYESMVDPTTELLNKNTYLKNIPTWFNQGKNLVFGDVIGFKDLNKEPYSHQIGDKFLNAMGKYFGQYMKDNPTSLVARWGGDEIVLITEGTITQAEYLMMNEGIKKMVLKEVPEIKPKDIPQFRARQGVPAVNETWQKWVDRLDMKTVPMKENFETILPLEREDELNPFIGKVAQPTPAPEAKSALEMEQQIVTEKPPEPEAKQLEIEGASKTKMPDEYIKPETPEEQAAAEKATRELESKENLFQQGQPGTAQPGLFPKTTADIGGYEVANTPASKIELPELIELAAELMENKYPSIMKSLGIVAGKFIPSEEGKILLAADIFKDPDAAAKTVGHEIGHLDDWLPEKTLERGNICGHIASLKRYLKHTIAAMPSGGKDFLEAKTRSQLHRQAERGAGTKPKKELLPADYNDWLARVKEEYQNLIKAEIQKRGLITKEEIMDELKKLTQMWKPFDETNPDAIKYRHNPKELYADAVSVLLNDPEWLKQIAPKFYKSFFAYMERKPQFKKVYEEILNRIAQGPEEVERVRQERIRKMYKDGEDVFREKRKARKGRSIIERLRHDVQDKNVAVELKVNEAIKKGATIDPQTNPAYLIEEMVYTTSEVEGWMRQLDKIYNELKVNNLTWEDLSDVLFHERIIMERDKMANPLGFTPEQSERQLNYLKKSVEEKFGADKFNKLVGLAKEFRKSNEYVLDKMAESNFADPAKIKEWKDNPHYATFLVTEHYEEKYGIELSAHVFPQIGVLKGVTNTATATVMKNIAIIKAINRQQAAKTTVDFIHEHFPGDIKPADTKFNGRAKVPVESQNPDWKLLAFPEGGELQAYYVKSNVGEIFNRSPETMGLAIKIGSLTNTVWRNVFVNKNPGFWPFNLIRDYNRLTKTMPGMYIVNVLPDYLKAIKPSFRGAWGIDDPIIAEMQKKKMLITMRGRWTADPEETMIEALLKRYLRNPKEYHVGIVKPFAKFFNALNNPGQMIEIMPKVAAYKYLTNLGFKEKQIGHMVRGMAGSPDFLKKGSSTPLFNNIFLFSNPMVQGWAGDIEAFSMNPGGYTAKTILANIIPKLLLYGGALGILGTAPKRMIDGIPEYDKSNYTIVPLGMDKNGKTVYIRVPQDEVGRLIGGIFWKALSLNQPKDLANLADYMAGQGPTLTPTIEIASDVMQYFTGKNPYNYFTGRYIIDETVFEAGGTRSLKDFLKYQARQAGIGVVYKFESSTETGVKTELEKVLGLPVLSNIIGRFIKVSDRGISEKIYGVLDDVRSVEAEEILKARDALGKVLQGKVPSLEEWIAVENHPGVMDNNFVKQIVLRYGTSAEAMLMKARNDTERVAVLQEIIKIYGNK